MLTESHSAVNAPAQYGHNVARDQARRMWPRTSAHRGGCECELCRETRSHPAKFLLPPSDRRGNDVFNRPLPSPKDIAQIEMASHVPQWCALRRIPPEILGIIFESCLDERTSSLVSFSEPPLLFGRVCSYWRSVSHRTPRLWTSFSFRFLETDVDRSNDGIKVAAAVETWLHRSYPIPLSIAFTDHRIYQKDTEDVVVWLLSQIRMHAPRWKAIHIKFSSDYFTQLCLLSSCTFTSLTSFSVHIDHMGWRSGLLSFRLDLAQATRLTSLACTGPEHVVREDILVDWTRLTSISFSYDLHESGGGSATLSRHFSTLAQCRNLTELSIGLSTPAQHWHQMDIMAHGQTMIELPRLHTLRVRRLNRSAHACALIDMLRLPQLSTLYIDSAILVGWNSSHMPSLHPDVDPPLPVHMQVQAQTHWWHARHFSALLERSSCRLRALHIRDVDVSPPEVARLLMSPNTSATLSTFTFEPVPRAYPISDVLPHLAPTPSTSPSTSPTSPSDPHLPLLTQLRLSCAHEMHLDALADAVDRRTGQRAAQAGVRPLAVFELVFYDFVYRHGPGGQPRRKACFDAFKDRVLTCAREGVDVDIRVERPYEPGYISMS